MFTDERQSWTRYGVVQLAVLALIGAGVGWLFSVATAL